MTTIDSNNCIPTGLRADVMRRSMENKNLLSKKGSIYIGTGEYISVGGEKIYKTKALNPGKAGEILCVLEDGSVGYSKLINSSFNSSVDYENFRKLTFPSVKLLPNQFTKEISAPEISLENSNFSNFDGGLGKIRLFGPLGENSTSVNFMSSGSPRTLTLTQDSNTGLVSWSGEGWSNSSMYLIQTSLTIKWYDPQESGSSPNITTVLYFSFIDKDGEEPEDLGSLLYKIRNRGGGPSGFSKGVLFPDSYRITSDQVTPRAYETVYIADYIWSGDERLEGINVVYSSAEGAYFGETGLISDQSKYSWTWTSTKLT